MDNQEVKSPISQLNLPLDQQTKQLIKTLTDLATGIVTLITGSTAPEGYLPCAGASYLRADYPNLFGKIGTTFGSADAQHFNVPDLSASVPSANYIYIIKI